MSFDNCIYCGAEYYVHGNPTVPCINGRAKHGWVYRGGNSRLVIRVLTGRDNLDFSVEPGFPGQTAEQVRRDKVGYDVAMAVQGVYPESRVDSYVTMCVAYEDAIWPRRYSDMYLYADNFKGLKLLLEGKEGELMEHLKKERCPLLRE